jgi:NarL family two-component system response regulator LiaR
LYTGRSITVCGSYLFHCRNETPMSIRVLIVDDHAVVRQGLQIFLDIDPDIVIVGEAADGEAAVKMARQLRPDVVLMDLLLPLMDGVTATGHIRRELPDTEVIALTSVLENNSVFRAIQAGAIGYLLKDTEAPRLRDAIKAAADGKVQLSPEAATVLLREVRMPTNPDRLTERETEVLHLLANGCSNKEIARQLQIAETTVKSHVKSIMQKLDVASRTQAALYAVRAGLVIARRPDFAT